MVMNKMCKIFRLLSIVILLCMTMAAPVRAGEYQSLIGIWQRTDGGYVLEVSQVDKDGKAEARYFNPRPINVSHARTSKKENSLKLFVELRDRGYPGSTYTLVYMPKKDALFGYYYHAASGQKFDVLFTRMK